MDETKDNINMINSDKYVSFPSEVSFHWLNWLLKKGYKRPLRTADLQLLSYPYTSENSYERFKTAFSREAVSLHNVKIS